MPYKDTEKNKACQRAFNQSERGKFYKREWYLRNKRRNKESTFLRKYRISYSEYELMLLKQDFVCAICEKPCASGRELAVDHCHKTSRVRGLLCLECNRGLGALKASISLLKSAIEYLEK